MSRYAVRLTEVGRRDTASVGGKSASLGELARAGALVPPGFALTTTAFGEAMAALDPVGQWRRRVAGLDPDDIDAVAGVTGQLRHRIETAPVPEGVQREVRRHYRGLAADGTTPVAVRSSATSEDGVDASFAGLQDTYLWVRGDESVLTHVRRCWASLYSVESVTYRLRRGLPEDGLAMAVVVQQMVDPRCSGVLFTRSPLTGDRSVMVVEAAWGLGSAVVSGDVTPDHLVVNKVTGEVVKRAVSRKLRRHRRDPSGAGVQADDVPAGEQEVCCLRDEEVAALVEAARRIEDHYGSPQDIEWAIAVPDPAEPSGERLYILQSRPETVWARRKAAPVAPPRPRAFDHVVARLGRSAGTGG
jgi:pyruvate,water dikinase